ncbi:MAG: type II and III secretion system protein family protein [Hyphomicrobiaceae bacterium]|nr:MAG: type II and III secretion system protein family protein [Hyphomicrobiaceae bacterium]
MRISPSRLWTAAALAVVAAAGAHMLPASAQQHRTTLEGDHHSVLKIANHEHFPIHRAVRIGRNKSMMIELPREVRDVVISDPNIVDAVVQSSSRVFLIGKKDSGQANAFFFDANGERIMTLEITIDRDVAALEQLYKRLMPKSRIKVEMLHDTVVLTGIVPNPADATRAADIASRFASIPSDTNNKAAPKVINLLAVEGKEQVMLRVTVAEVNRTILKQMGVNLGAVINSGNFSTTLLTSNAFPLTSAAGLGKLPVPGIDLSSSPGTLKLFNTGPAASTFGNSGLTTGWGTENQAVVTGIRLLERDGLLRTLAEPNLTAISGETARFLAGGEFPIPVVDSTGQITVTFKKFGVGLAFTPIVSAEDRISLKIESEVSELSDQGAVTLSSISIPALKTRQANTTIELPSGGSLAIAGLLSDNTRQNIDGVPGLKDMPILGTLFRSRDYIKQETELVIIVTPIIVKPVARNVLARPDDGLAPASDLKANLLGHFNRIYGKGEDHVPVGKYESDFGFIVE